MEVDNIGIPVILQGMNFNGDEARRNSTSVFPRELEPHGGDFRRNSIPEIPQEMDPEGGDVRGNSNLVIPQEIESNGGGDSRRSSIGKVDPPSDIKRNSIPVIPPEMEPNGDDRNFIAVIPQEIEPNGSDIKQNFIPVIPQEMEPNGGDIRRSFIEKADPDIESNSVLVIAQEMEPTGGDARRNSIAVTPQEIESNGSGIRRNSIAWIPQEMEPKGGDTRRGYVLVIPHEIEPNGGDIRRSSNGVKIRSRYLSARIASCHDNCKYGVRNASQEKATTAMSKPDKEIGSAGQILEATTSAKKKKISTTSPKPSPDSDTQKLNNLVVTEKKVISLTKKETVSSKKVPSSFKEIDVSMEDSIDLKVKRVLLGPSSLPESALSLSNSKVISTTGPRSFPDVETRKLNNSVVMEKKVSSSAKKETVSSKKVSSPKEIDVCTEQLIDLKVKGEQLEPSSLPGSVLSLSNSTVISTIGPTPSPDSETLKSVVTEKKVSSPFKDIDVSTEGSIDSKVKPEQLQSSSLPEQGSSNQGKGGTRKSKEIPESSRVNRKLRSKNPRTSVVEKKMLEPETVNLTPKAPIKRVSEVNTGSCKNLKGVSHLKDQNNPGKDETEGPCNNDVPEKILYVIESNTENSTVEPTPNGVDTPKLSSSSPSSKLKSLKQARKGIGTTRSPQSSEKKNLKRIVNGGCARSPAPLFPENKGLRRSTRTSLSSSSSSSSSMSISPAESTHNTENGATSQCNTMKTDNLKVEHKTRPRRSVILSSESKNSSPRKLTFRRGRVVDLKPEINTPRRLKFRRVRLVGEIQSSKGSIKGGSIGRKEVDDGQSNGAGIKKGSIVRKEVGDSQSNGAGIKKGSIRRKEVDDSRSNGAIIKRGSAWRKKVDDSQSNAAKIKFEKVVLRNQEQDVEGSPRKSFRRKAVSHGVSSGTRASPEKVVLRHQDVKGRKDVQKLLNNVIEETASRLVETRKSKVKALVGAFETVISLQDTKPSATADAS